MNQLTYKLSDAAHRKLFALIRKYLLLYSLLAAFGIGIYFYEKSLNERLVATFHANEQILCDNEFVKKASGWQYDTKSRVFFNDTSVFHILIVLLLHLKRDSCLREKALKELLAFLHRVYKKLLYA